MKRYTDEYRCSWRRSGYTYEEAIKKKASVDEVHCGNNSQWEPSRIVPDERGGFKVIVSARYSE